MKTINQTLKKKLIVAPNPKCNKREFLQLNDRMFGDKNDIIEFLDSTETQKKFELSKRIIMRLAFESNFPPSMELLNYIHDFESTVRYKRSIKHASRDHYIHLCYLYLLGLYLFFYYPNLNNQLQNALSLVRFSDGISEENCFVKNYISVWKYFVLYHDIAYQFEYLGNSNNAYLDLEEEERKKTIELFSPLKIKSAIIDGMKIKSLATIIAVNSTISEKSGKTANTFSYLKRHKEQFERVSGGLDFDDFLKNEEDKQITFLKYVKAGDDIKYYLTLYQYSDFFVILKEDSDIKCIIGGDFYFADKEIMDKTFIQKIKNNKSLVFSDEIHAQFPQYTIEYYGMNMDEKMKEFIQEIGAQISLIEGFDFGVKTSYRMKDVVFDCYLKCYNYLRKDNPEKDIKELEENCKSELFKKFNIESWQSGKIEEGGVYSYAQDFLKNYLGHIEKYIKNFDEIEMDKIKTAAATEFRQEYIKKKDLESIYNKIGRKIEKEIFLGSADCEQESDVCKLYSSERYNIIFDLLSDSDKKYVTSSLQSAVNNTEMRVQEILGCYRTKYSEYDHGISASNVSVLHFHYYQKIVEQSSESMLVRMCFNIPNLSDESVLKSVIKNKYILDYSETLRQVIYAILVHNLYPDNFRDNIEGIKTSGDANPFAYFCMLCDALQDWGRPFNVNPVEEDYPLFLDSLKINIKLDDFINVKFMEDDPQMIEKRLKPFTKELNSYLEGTGNLMKVKFV